MHGVGVTVKDTNHPCCGAYGLFARRDISTTYQLSIYYCLIYITVLHKDVHLLV
jgi:hypothetical protein